MAKKINSKKGGIKKSASTQKQTIRKVVCPNCNTKNLSTAKFCSNCGLDLTKIEKIAKQEEKEMPKKESKKVIMGHFKPKFFMILGAAIVGIGLVAFYIFAGGKTGSSTYSPQCTNDSQCSQGSYCSSFGACLRSTCGDGICTSQERQSSSCPVDCGCAQGQVLNKYLNQCQTSLVLSQTAINNLVNNWLSHNAINGTITTTNDAYYGNQTVKLVNVNCAPPNAQYPCQMTFYINYQAQIVNVTSTT